MLCFRFVVVVVVFSFVLLFLVSRVCVFLRAFLCLGTQQHTPTWKFPYKVAPSFVPVSGRVRDVSHGSYKQFFRGRRRQAEAIANGQLKWSGA